MSAGIMKAFIQQHTAGGLMSAGIMKAFIQQKQASPMPTATTAHQSSPEHGTDRDETEETDEAAGSCWREGWG